MLWQWVATAADTCIMHAGCPKAQCCRFIQQFKVFAMYRGSIQVLSRLNRINAWWTKSSVKGNQEGRPFTLGLLKFQMRKFCVAVLAFNSIIRSCDAFYYSSFIPNTWPTKYKICLQHEDCFHGIWNIQLYTVAYTGNVNTDEL